MDYKEFFEKYGQTETPTIEETYQAFKARLKNEIEVFTTFLTDKDEQMSELDPGDDTDVETDEGKAESDLMKLLSCPFCGSGAFIWPAMLMKGYGVSCKNDCISMPSRPGSAFTSKAIARAHWNSRAR